MSDPATHDEQLPLRILLLEDDEADAEQLEDRLRSDGFPIELLWVKTRSSFQHALADFAPDLVLADYSLPRFTGLDAIQMAHTHSPLVPVIIVTGALDDETAAGCIKGGAADYVLKDRLARLKPAIDHALNRKCEQEQKLEVEAELQQLSRAIEQSPASVVITDAEGTIEYVNPRFTGMSGYTAEEVIGQNPRLLKSGQTLPSEYESLWKTITSGDVWRGELCNRSKDGALYWVETTISPIVDSRGVSTHFIATSEDVSIRKNYELRLLHQANYDDLTGLPNRVLALDRLSQAIVGAKRDQRIGAALLVDLDRLQIVNECLTHQAGDELLKQAALRLKKCLRDDDTVARLVGDEFLLIPRHLNGSTEAENLALRVLETFSKPFVLEGQEFFITVSVGISLFFKTSENPQVLLREVDSAMRRVKEKGGNSFQFFVPELNVQLRKRMSVESKLRHAIERDELSLHYQPMIEPGPEKIIGAEALVRWNNPDLHSVSPAYFIPIAEEAGLVVPIGEWVLRTACKEAMRWQERSGQLLQIGVNVSSAQFAEGNFVHTVLQSLKESGLPPHLLTLEITETLLMANTSSAVPILQQLREIGVSVALDDFGTGYCSLAYLRNLPIDTLKVDGIFVKDVTSNPEAAGLMAGIIGLTHSLGLSVVVEGVETRDQLDFVSSLDCDVIQGFYFSKPLPADEFSARLEPGGNWRGGLIRLVAN